MSENPASPMHETNRDKFVQDMRMVVSDAE